MPEQKPIAIKPSLYAVFFEKLKPVAKEYGYNLCVHGSMNRDMDLIAFPWGGEAKPHLQMVEEFKNLLGGQFNQVNNEGDIGELRPNGSWKYIINIWRNKPFSAQTDKQYYVDVNVFPAPSESASTRQGLVWVKANELPLKEKSLPDIVVTLIKGKPFAYDTSFNINGLREVLKQQPDALCHCLYKPESISP